MDGAPSRWGALITIRLALFRTHAIKWHPPHKNWLSGRTPLALELVDHVHAKEELVPALPGVVSARIPGVVEAHLRAEQHRIADILRRIECVLGVLASNPRALSLLIVKKVRPETHKHFGLISRFT